MLDKKQVQNTRDTKKIIHRLCKYLFKSKCLILLAFLLAISSNFISLLGPVLSGYAIDSIGFEAGKVLFDKVLFYCMLMIVFYIISSILSYLLSIVMINISQKTVYSIRKDILDKLLELPIKYFDSHQTGDIISRISYDIDTVNSTLSTDLIQIFTSAITVIGSLVMMLSISPKLVLVFVITVPTSLILTKYMTGKVRPLFRKRSASLGYLNGFVEEIISGQNTIKIYNQQTNMIKKFDDKNEEAVNAYYNADYYGSMIGPCVNFINNLSLSLISMIGALLYLFGSLTIGNLSAFVLYSRKFSGPINEAANIISELQSTISAADRIFKLMDEDPEPLDKENSIVLDNIDGNVNIENVSFGYTNEKIIIDNMNLKAPKGNLIAIVGPTGAGKTTIINLLMRFYDPQKGSITIDDINIQNVTRKSLRLCYAMVLQDAWLFHGTIFDNIAYGKKDATLDDVISAAKSARIHDYIDKLPDGYMTILNEDGINISQGQKQLLTIARAMLLDSNILILDEATSNVDTRTEMQIQTAMRKLMQNKTCFVIAHRLSTIQNADTILVVENGKIAEQGTHDELLDLNKIYASLYNSQFQ